MNIYRIFSIIGLGFITSLLFTLMLYLIYAQVLVDFILDNISNYMAILTIILGLFGITIVISYLVGFIINRDLKNIIIIRAGIMALLSAFSTITIFSYLAASNYLEIFLYLEWWEILLVFPQVIAYYAIYGLNSFFSLILQYLIVYYIFYGFFITLFRGEMIG